MSKTETHAEKVLQSMQAILNLRTSLQDVEDELTTFAGMIASFGIRVKNGTFARMSTRLKRIDTFLIPETVTALEQTASLIRNGVEIDAAATLKDLLGKRSTMISEAILSFEDNAAIMDRPDLRLDIRSARINPQTAIENFSKMMGKGPTDGVTLGMLGARLKNPRYAIAMQLKTNPGYIAGKCGVQRDTIRDLLQEAGPGLFSDFSEVDLPEDARRTANERIRQDPKLSRFTFDELMAIKTLRTIILNVEHYGYGVAKSHRRHISKARRAFLWSVPRIAHIMVQHPLTWRHNPQINSILYNVRHYDRHMRDMAKIAPDDDWFDARSPLIVALKDDVRLIDDQAREVVAAVKAGPSAHRFSSEFYSVMPIAAMNFSRYYQPDADDIVRTMSSANISEKLFREHRDTRGRHEQQKPTIHLPQMIDIN